MRLEMKMVKHKFDIMLKYLGDKEILDLGCVDHIAIKENNKAWVHKFLIKHAKSVIGVDFEEAEVQTLNKMGYNIVHADVETMDLNRQFDVIVAGELIEHVNNQGIFLNNVRKHLKPKGYFILTTPNCFSFRNILRSFLFGKTLINPQHTLWHCSTTLTQLLERLDWEIVESAYSFDPYSSKWRYLVERFFSLFHKSLSPDMIFVVKISDK